MLRLVAGLACVLVGCDNGTQPSLLPDLAEPTTPSSPPSPPVDMARAPGLWPTALPDAGTIIDTEPQPPPPAPLNPDITPATSTGWQWENPLPQGNTLNIARTPSAGDLWVFGGDVVMRGDGAHWTLSSAPQHGNVVSTGGSSPTDLWISTISPGDAYSARVWQWSGSDWTNRTPALPPMHFQPPYTDVILGGGSGFLSLANATGFTLRWQNGAWQAGPPSPFMGTIDPEAFTPIGNQLWLSSSVNQIFDGTSWSQAPYAGSVAGGSGPDDVWILPDRTADLTHSGTSVPTPFLGRIWSRGPSDAWLAFNGVAHFDGSTFHVLQPETPGSDYRAALDGGDGSMWFFGDGGQILHCDTVGCAPGSTGSRASINGIWGASADDLWAVGSGGTLLHRGADGRWTPTQSPTARDLGAISGSAKDNVWAVGKQGRIIAKIGGTWERITPFTNEDLTMVSVLSPKDVYVGSMFALYHYDGNIWSMVRDLHGNYQGPIAGLAVNGGEVWLLLNNQPPHGVCPDMCPYPSVERYVDGALVDSKFRVPEGVGFGSALLVSSSGEVFVSGAFGYAHFDGSGWSYRYGQALSALTTDGTTVFAIDGGTVARWDGIGFVPLDLPLARQRGDNPLLTLFSVGGTVWVAGGDGALLRRDPSGPPVSPTLPSVSRPPPPVNSTAQLASAGCPTRVEALGDSTCALFADSSVWCWGAPLYQYTSDRPDPTPQPIAPAQVFGSGITDLSMSNTTIACALETSGVVFCWGGGSHSSTLPPPETTSIGWPGPTQVDAPAIQHLARNDSCGFDIYGVSWCWHPPSTTSGHDNGFTPQITLRNSGLGAITDVENGCGLSGSSITCLDTIGLPQATWSLPSDGVTIDGDHVLATDGKLYQLHPLTADQLVLPSPSPMPGLDNVAEADGSCVRFADGTVACDDGTGSFQKISIDSVRRIASGRAHACAIRDDGLWCWGDNSWGQLGVSAPAASATPIQTISCH